MNPEDQIYQWELRQRQIQAGVTPEGPPPPKSEVIRALTLRYLGALSQVIGIRNKVGRLVGYREGFTKSKLEEMARKHAKQAYREGPSAFMRGFREDLQKDPQFAKAVVAGWPKEQPKEQPEEKQL
jgi:hypothetical protein